LLAGAEFATQGECLREGKGRRRTAGQSEAMSGRRSDQAGSRWQHQPNKYNMGKKRIITKNDPKEKKKEEGAGVASSAGKSKISKNVKEGIVFISSSYNNTIITLADSQGNVLFWSTAGKIGFSGAKKCTPFAASKVAEVVAQIIESSGIEKIAVVVKGIGPGRDSAIRSFVAKGINIISIKDVTPAPHNGCRPKKPRRI